jgi:hypothetical protein
MNRTTLAGIALAALMATSLFVNGCKKEDNPAAPTQPAVEHPPASTVQLILTLLDGAGNPTTTMDTCIVRDTTIDRVKQPLTGQLDLKAGKSYQGTFKLYDGSVNPTVEITNDIISEKDAHVFKFTFTGTDTSRVTVTNRDLDSKGLPFGLNFKVNVTAGPAATGNLHVILEHHDDGNKAGTEFDLDLDRDFPVAIAP